MSNMEEARKKVDSVTAMLSIFLGSVAITTLLVGGIGIMNIMFVSVSERTKEIGLRKAIGANNIDILFQFIVEAVFICCIGGVIGILLGSGAATIVGKLTKLSPGMRIIGMEVNPVITPFSVILSFSFSVFTGLVFGVLPARKASLLSPVEALRYD
ncbi:hypothetical protein AGMMS49921_02430 [Endomicrobiia bacterium]|nr:hypothetical protein AGMMS49921_02430 [Endomicrobiia bacterium]